MKKILLLMMLFVSIFFSVINVSASDVATASDVFTIVIEPQEVVASSGDIVTITATVDSDVEVSKYCWQFSSDGGSSWGNSSSPGFATNIIKISVTDNQVGRSVLYRCLVTDVNGNTVTSGVSYVIVVDSDVSTDEDCSYHEEVIQNLQNSVNIQLQTLQFLIFVFIVSVLYLIFRSFICF